MEEGLFASFPHQPYDIQKKFMLNAYDTLEQRQIGLFESPTGKGLQGRGTRGSAGMAFVS